MSTPQIARKASAWNWDSKLLVLKLLAFWDLSAIDFPDPDPVDYLASAFSQSNNSSFYNYVNDSTGPIPLGNLYTLHSASTVRS